MDELGTDLGRAFVGAAVGVGVGGAMAAGVASGWPLWAAVPGGIAFVGVGALAGAWVALVVGDWWDRR